MLEFFSTAAFAILSTFAVTQAPPPAGAGLPDTLWLRLHPDSLGGQGTDNIYIQRIAEREGRITAIVLLDGRGQDGCQIDNKPAQGRYDGQTLSLEIVVEQGDLRTCPASYELKRGPDGRFAGRYTSRQFQGTLQHH